MKVTSVDGDQGSVASGGLTRKANFILLKDIKPGDYVLLHAGFAIAKVKPKEARETLKMVRNL
jgi:hydrogenase expression/formation protein HypC